MGGAKSSRGRKWRLRGKIKNEEMGEFGFWVFLIFCFRDFKF